MVGTGTGTRAGGARYPRWWAPALERGERGHPPLGAELSSLSRTTADEQTSSVSPNAVRPSGAARRPFSGRLPEARSVRRRNDHQHHGWLVGTDQRYEPGRAEIGGFDQLSVTALVCDYLVVSPWTHRHHQAAAIA